MIKQTIIILSFIFFLVVPVKSMDISPAKSMEVTTVIYNITDVSVTFQFMVMIPIRSSNPNLYLEYGLDETYGNIIPIELKHETIGGLSVTVPATVSGLNAGTKYHYHLVIKDRSAKLQIHSMDNDFTTAEDKKQSL